MNSPRPTPTPRRSWPTGPRCRAGASSLLRLAATLPSSAPAAPRFASGLDAMRRQLRLAEALASAPEPAFGGSIITRLLPSCELAGR